MSSPLILTPTAPVAGGAAMAREESGRVVFVAGALPGEEVEVFVHEQRRDFARADVVRVIRPSPDRVEPPCPHVSEGCGGCDAQYVTPEGQRALKRAVVADSLRRLGRLPDTTIHDGPVLATHGFRTTVRCGVIGMQAAFRQRGSHDLLEVDSCLVAHPRIEDLIRRGGYGGATEVTFRVGDATGEGLVLASPSAAAIELPDDVWVSDPTDESSPSGETPVTGWYRAPVVVGQDELDAGRRAWFHERVAGHTFRISARSFFQSRTDGAEALVEVVRAAGGDELAGAGVLVDAYGGVGLFGALLTPDGARLTLIESNRSAVVDAKLNLAHLDAKVVRSDVETWHPTRADVVIADPARAGLGKKGTAVLAATRAAVIVLVSCDAAALGRDARLLAERGYDLEQSSLVDLFPHTHHVEVVSRFVRRPAN